MQIMSQKNLPYDRYFWPHPTPDISILLETSTNSITMDVEITKSDLKTIVSKASHDNKFNAIKNALARDIPTFLLKSKYLGWRTVKEGKHEESAYFTYFDRTIGVKTILVMRKMKNGGPYKPYAIIDQYAFSASIDDLKQGTPP